MDEGVTLQSSPSHPRRLRLGPLRLGPLQLGPHAPFGPHAPPRAADRVWLITAALATGAALLVAIVLPRLGSQPASGTLPWLVLLGLFYLAEFRVIHLQFRGEAQSYSMSEVPLVLGLFLVAPADLVAAAVLGSGAALLVHRRPPVRKAAFNLALFASSSAFAAVLFNAVVEFLGSADPITPSAWLAALVASTGAMALGLGAIAAVLRIVEGRPDRRRIGQSVRLGLTVAIANTGVALVAVTLLAIDPRGFLALAIPVPLAFAAYRTYRSHVAEQEQRDSLALLHDATRVLHDSTDLSDAVVQLLAGARRRFHADLAEIVLYTDREEPGALRTVLGPGDRSMVMVPEPIGARADRLPLLVARGRVAVRLNPAVARRSGDTIAGTPITDAMVAPLLSEQRLVGSFLVANRNGNLGSFSPDELRLFQTLANHAGIALSHGQLGRSVRELSAREDQLRREASTDDLTGLAKRAVLFDRLDAALRRHDAGSSPPPALLFIDLDEFKAVNDRLGHAAGDETLRDVARRVEACVRSQDVAARVGGDEFAILVEDGDDRAAVDGIARRLVDTIGSMPVLARDGSVASGSVTATIGIGIARAGMTPACLLREADVAMYAAKTSGKARYAVYDVTMDEPERARLALREELTRALREGEFRLRYQPITDLVTGRVTSVEALLRWEHPTRGELEPAVFMPAAEETGLIVPLGRWTLRTACRQLAEWRAVDGGRGLSVGVNLSAKQLSSEDLLGDVTDALRDAGLPAGALVLEIPESQLSANAVGVAARLRALKQLGVKLAVDNFGSGLSSLAYLGRTPVDALKISRSFVAAIASPSVEQARLTGAIVALGHSLKLSVIAGGVEHLAQLDHLRALRCDGGQGYLFARPLEADALGDLLRPGSPPLRALAAPA